MVRRIETGIIGLTGGIGAGKSIVARTLRLRGFEVYDCDIRARRIMEEDPFIVSSLKGRFGEECYDASGALARQYLAAKLFSSETQRNWLNALIHKAVREDIVRWKEKREPAFVESAILHTSGLDRICREIWIVEADEHIRFRRAMQRGGISEENLRLRMQAQKNEFDALECQVIKRIDNSGLSALLWQLDRLLENIEKNN
ncbi:MAG: dephospho-CoA kinase [Muribaculaceae bacterium]|nr:dephospho-CoA kinase [Muribaculaceae bacterium]